MEPVQTLHDFALGLLSDTDAMSAFESNPEGVLQAAGLEDITAQDVQDILPLVVDYASDPDLGTVGGSPFGNLGDLADLGSSLNAVDELDALSLSDADTNLGNVAATTTALAEDLTGDLGTGDVTTDGNAVHGLSDTVSDVLAGDLDVDDLGVGELGVGELDEVQVGDTGLDLVDNVTSAVQTSDLHITDTLNFDTLDDTVGDVTGNLSGNPVTTALSDIAGDSGNLTGNLSQIHDVVNNVGLNGDLTGVGAVTDVVGDLGDIDVGGIANGNDVAF